MKRVIALMAIVLLAACESQRHGVPCVGVLSEKQPGVKYEASVLNICVGVIFAETIVVPLVVVANEFACPVDGVSK